MRSRLPPSGFYQEQRIMPSSTPTVGEGGGGVEATEPSRVTKVTESREFIKVSAEIRTDSSVSSGRLTRLENPGGRLHGCVC